MIARPLTVQPRLLAPHDLQSSLRTEFVEQELRRLGIHVTFAEDDQVSRIPKRIALDEDPRMQGAEDEGDEVADDLVAMNSDWWDIYIYIYI